MQPRSSAPHTLAERLNVEKERIEAELRKTNPGPRRGELERKLRQLDMGIVSRATSAEVKPPQLAPTDAARG